VVGPCRAKKKNGHRFAVPESRYQRRRVENPRPKPWAFDLFLSNRDASVVFFIFHIVTMQSKAKSVELSAVVP
jgi:hypothetical protein